MSIHKTPEGTYRVRWREHGRLKSKTFKRKIDAEHFKARITIGDGPAEPTTSAEAMTFAEYSEIWMRDYGQVYKTASSLIRDRQMLRDHFLPAWGHLPLSSITKRDIVALQSRLKAEGRLKDKSINNVMGFCHKLFADALRWDFLTSNPSQGLRPIKVHETDYAFWTFDERDRFLSYAKANEPDLYPVVAFAVHTGLRRGEVEGLRRDCLDFDRRQVIVKRSFCHKTGQLNEHTKGKKIRRVPMNDLVFRLLRERSLLKPSDAVFPLDYEHFVARRFDPAQKAAGVTRLRFHDLRHTFASHLAMAGVGVFDIKTLLGHSDIRTTMRYMHLAPDHLDGVTDKLLSRPEPKGPAAGQTAAAP